MLLIFYCVKTMIENNTKLNRKIQFIKRKIAEGLLNIKIVADENIPFAADAFAHIGSVELFPGREIKSAMLKNADILLVRSVTKVDARLLHGSKIKMVCSVTIGVDHIDTKYLAGEKIAFANAAGSNANSVAEYVMAAVLELAVRFDWQLSGLKMSVVGMGNIGKIVARKAAELGMTVLHNDPPLARQTGAPHYLPLNDLLQADIITLHVPLTMSGRDKTYHLFDKNRIARMKPGSVLINSSRGAVVDNAAVKKALQTRCLKTAVLDVWENEPAIDRELLPLIELGTPHIAGYSLDGKVNGVFQVYQAVCKRFHIRPRWRPENSLPEPEKKKIRLSGGENRPESLLADTVRQIYDIRADDVNLRKIQQLNETDAADYFEQLRKTYPVRREFYHTTVILPRENGNLSSALEILGFKTGVKNLPERKKNFRILKTWKA